MSAEVKPPEAGGILAQKGPAGKKSVLLVDADPVTREARADSMRALGVMVHAVSSGGAARARLESAAYSMVLLDVGRDTEGTEKLAASITARHPQQLIGYLVGSPAYVVTSLNGRPPKRSKPAPPSIATKAPELDFAQRIRNAEAESSGS